MTGTTISSTFHTGARLGFPAAALWLVAAACASGGGSSDAGFEVSRAGVELPDSLRIEHDAAPQLVNPDEVRRVLETEYQNWLAEQERLRQRVGRTPMPWRGRVTVHLYITSAGTTSEVVLVEATGRAEVDQAAVRAASTMRWIPATKDGEPVAVWSVQTFRF